MKAFLDTHAAIGLYEGDEGVFGQAAINLIERVALFLSPVVRLELALLHEIGRVEIGPDEILRGLTDDWGVVVADDPIAAVIARAMSLTWTRDPFDRLLVATAMLHRAPLITRDQKMHEHFSEAVW